MRSSLILPNDYRSYLWWRTIPELRFLEEYAVTALEYCTYDLQQLGYASVLGCM